MLQLMWNYILFIGFLNKYCFIWLCCLSYKKKPNQLHAVSRTQQCQDMPFPTFRRVLEALRDEWRNSAPRFAVGFTVTLCASAPRLASIISFISHIYKLRDTAWSWFYFNYFFFLNHISFRSRFDIIIIIYLENKKIKNEIKLN